MAPQTRTYGGIRLDERRARRQAALLDAALDLVAESGVASLTVRGVCSRAKLNDRYFYENFKTTDELALAMLDDQLARGTEAIVSAIAASAQSTDPQVRTRAAIGAGVRFLTEDPRRGRLLIDSQATEGLAARRRDYVQVLATVMADNARAILDPRDALDPDLDIATIALVSGGLEVATLWLRGDLDMSPEHLEDFLVELVTRRR